jgi:hypothetical protein
MSLRVADGFKFGCGLMLAAATALVLLLLLVAVAILAARFSGNDIALPSPGTTVSPPGPSFQAPTLPPVPPPAS